MSVVFSAGTSTSIPAEIFAVQSTSSKVDKWPANAELDPCDSVKTAPVSETATDASAPLKLTAVSLNCAVMMSWYAFPFVPLTKAWYHPRHLVIYTMFTKYFMVIHTK